MTGIQAYFLSSILDPRALTTVHSVRVQLNIPGTALDADLVYKIERLINAASASIEAYIDNPILEQEVIEIYDSRGSDRFIPRLYPITEVVDLFLDVKREFTDPIPSSSYSIVDKGTAIELLDRQFPTGRQVLKIHYKGGYKTVPHDISYACDLWVEWLYRLNEREDIGRTTRSKGDESVNISQNVPEVILRMLDPYKRMEFAGSTPRSIINV